ncbi:phosphate/phosphite/phosphonate ABC transporter substrate-binding protein [Ignatzschineria rhizosphaerae]|uniref:Phosphate/phosphite/phosphonate ABC transporter substrate-binding protein n=1 Tax=Ignatzschineria rhizosphaerae TaxID=2923279 RepID=A0ABY3WZS4_9GAMM|nr:phosphate/phosphite/phosphonate ABC transporter substrate-binding protein [Ignatzschineria rhizosphaerae]UNM96144.1 phosphate/phosphite/phosphonate ABC transporter substrate-binding protein [Ignatzschineria rhizosphaerae]
MRTIFLSLLFYIGSSIAGLSVAIGAECLYRGELANSYCDNNQDFLADTPDDPNLWVDPQTLIISFAPFGDYVATGTLFNPLLTYLESCLERRVIFYPMQSNEAEIAAMRSGRLHIAGFSTGSTVAAVNQAGAIPFATHGNHLGFVGAHLIVIVRSDSPYYKLSDLKNRRVIHSNATSLTGHLGALALFPKEGLMPGVDYPIIFSGKHDRSIQSVKSGDYDAATTTTEILERMIQYREVDKDDFRIIYQSQKFPSAALAYSYNLNPALQTNLRTCFFNYQFSPEMKQNFTGGEYFVPVDYQKDWAEIRQILKKMPTK